MVWFDPPVDVLNRSLQDPESRDHEKRSFLICKRIGRLQSGGPRQDEARCTADRRTGRRAERRQRSAVLHWSLRSLGSLAFRFRRVIPRSHGIGSDAFRPTVIQDDAPRILGRGGRRRGRREIALSGSERGCHHGTGRLSSLPAAARGFANRPLVGIAREAGLPRTWNISSSGVGARLARYAAILQTR